MSPADTLRAAAAAKDAWADRIEALAKAQGDRPRKWDWTGVGEHGYPQRVTALGNAALIAETFNSPDLPHPAAACIFALDRLANGCPTCSGPTRETVGMVCQTCGTDYGKPR